MARSRGSDGRRDSVSQCEPGLWLPRKPLGDTTEVFYLPLDLASPRYGDSCK